MAAGTTRQTREIRARVGTAVAALHGGVAHRSDLRDAGLSRHDVASEVSAGRWRRAGRHTVVIGSNEPTGEALLWRAVWETGAGAALDGAAALVPGGLTGFTPEAIVSFCYLLIVGSFVGFLAYTWLLQHVSSTLAGTHAYVNIQ